MLNRLLILSVITWLTLVSAVYAKQIDQESIIAQQLDNYHSAAANANAEKYLGLMADDSVFLGTDASERWTKPAFTEFVLPYFERGIGWQYIAKQRHIDLVTSDTAMFDELLWNDKYGWCRGSGVMVKTGQHWLIKQYSLSLMVPNELAGQVLAITKQPVRLGQQLTNDKTQ